MEFLEEFRMVVIRCVQLALVIVLAYWIISYVRGSS